MQSNRYRWAAPGDVNAFFGLVLDNLAGLILMVTLLAASFGFPASFAVSHMVPGTAIGVLVGDLAFFALAFYLARKTSRTDVTAMPLGLDTPSTFGMVFFVLGPAFLAGKSSGLEIEQAARYAWHIGIWSILFSGIFKFLCAPVSGLVRRIVPRAGLLGSLAAIALVLISFLPLLDIFAHPLPGFVALAIVLTSLIGRAPLPGRIPGTLAALIVAGAIFYLMRLSGVPGYEAGETLETQWLPGQWRQAWTGGWIDAFQDAINYLPVVLPFALGTIVGGIDCTESAAAAGDEYHTGAVIGIEAFATVVAGLCGGVIQTTPYIGHPAYKAMGGRAAYTLATALFIGSAGIIGYFGFILQWIPRPAVFPILIFVGLEITAQSFIATPRRHYAAIALACVPALAFLAINFPNQIFGDAHLFESGINAAALADDELKSKLATLGILQGGFILVSLLWAWILAAIIDRKFRVAGIVLMFTSIFTLFGIIHSPLPGNNRIFLPIGPDSWGSIVLPAALRPVIFEYAAGYAAAAVILLIWGWYLRSAGITTAKDHHRDDDEQGTYLGAES
jgi:AGZA family xanthine/uracil permease-like MFS transporter